jgi:2-polyprenyl-3-methyl-5-hydroxy-6-metoxy-1,4-benzoquinol methylase
MSKADKFLKELYTRLDKLNPGLEQGQMDIQTFISNEFKDEFLQQYKQILPSDKSIKILDIGVGNGWFASICHELGFQNIELADFGCKNKFAAIKNGLDQIIDLHDIETSLVDCLKEEKFIGKYDFIHMSHVLEHIPKYELIKLMDALNQSLVPNGTLFIRVPNLLGPVPFYYRYNTAGHEYGFVPSNLKQMCLVSNFNNIKFHEFDVPAKNITQILGGALRNMYLLNAKIKYRLFEGVMPECVKPELIISAQKI